MEQIENASSPASMQPIVKPMVPMALGELFGPVQCERPDCCKAAWMIWMTQEEYDTAKSQEETHPISHVFVNKIGTALCDECSQKSV
jgi:hypothetical protein